MQDPIFYLIIGLIVVLFLEFAGRRSGASKQEKNSSAPKNPNRAPKGPRDWEPVDPKKVKFR